MANLQWKKTDTGYEAKSAFGHYKATRIMGRCDTGKFEYILDGEKMGEARLLRDLKRYAQTEEDAREEAANREADARDEVASVDVTPDIPLVLNGKAGEVVIEDERCRCGELPSNCWCDGRRPDLEDYSTPTTSRESVDMQDEAPPPSGLHPIDPGCATCDGYGFEVRHTIMNDGSFGDWEEVPCSGCAQYFATLGGNYQSIVDKWNNMPDLNERARKGKDGVEPTIPPYDSLRKEGALTEEKVTHIGSGDVVREYSVSVMSQSTSPRIDPNLAKSKPKVGDIVRFTIKIVETLAESEECRVKIADGNRCKLTIARNGDTVPGMVEYERIMVMRRPKRYNHITGVSEGPWTSSR